MKSLCWRKCNQKIYPSFFWLSNLVSRLAGYVGVHPGQVAYLSQGEHRETDNHSHNHIHNYGQLRMSLDRGRKPKYSRTQTVNKQTPHKKVPADWWIQTLDLLNMRHWWLALLPQDKKVLGSKPIYISTLLCWNGNGKHVELFSLLFSSGWKLFCWSLLALQCFSIWLYFFTFQHSSKGCR